MLQSDALAKVVQSELVVDAMVRAFAVSSELRSLVDARLRSLMRELRVLTEEDVAGLRAEVHELRERLEAVTARAEAAIDKLEG